MTRRIVRRAGAVLLLAVPGVMFVSACASPSPATPATASPAPASAGPARAGASSAAPEQAGASSACTAAGIEVTLTEQPQRRAGDSRMALVQLTNTSGRTCEMAGWPVITLANAAGEAVAVPVKDVAQPGEPVPAELAPGAGAFAGIKWTVCDKADTDCPTGNSIEVGLAKGGPLVAAALEGFPNAEQSGISFGSLQVGTVQPSIQGVVAW